MGRRSDAVESLPDILAEPESVEPEYNVAQATGTDGANVLADCLMFQGAKGGISRHESAQEKKEFSREIDGVKALQTEGIVNDNEPEELEAAAGFEPAR